VQQFGPHEVASPQLNEQPPDAQQKIAARAYELACLRGFTNGSELDDWLQAETELGQEAANATS
jgi:hypothetical protein